MSQLTHLRENRTKGRFGGRRGDRKGTYYVYVKSGIRACGWFRGLGTHRCLQCPSPRGPVPGAVRWTSSSQGTHTKTRGGSEMSIPEICVVHADLYCTSALPDRAPERPVCSVGILKDWNIRHLFMLPFPYKALIEDSALHERHSGKRIYRSCSQGETSLKQK